MLCVHVEDQHEFFTRPRLSSRTGGAGDGRSVRVLGMFITSKISYYGWNNEALSGQVSELREVTTYIYRGGLKYGSQVL